MNHVYVFIYTYHLGCRITELYRLAPLCTRSKAYSRYLALCRGVSFLSSSALGSAPLYACACVCDTCENESIRLHMHIYTYAYIFMHVYK